MNDEQYMSLSLKLAKKAIGRTNPNPMVGAVIVKDGQIIGKGYHRAYGQAHAEIEAISSVKKPSLLKNATMYVNLEPCLHYGQTPPCTEAIIASGISRVVCAGIDPNPLVGGKGLKRLKAAGVKVTLGPNADPAARLNEAFISFHTLKRPFITLKFASSLDGKLATSTGDSKWITNQTTRDYARRLRSAHQAVIVGIDTVIADDPDLGPTGKMKAPIRIILDSELKISPSARVLRDKNVLIATTGRAASSKRNKLESLGYEVMTFRGSSSIPVGKLVEALAQKGIISVFVEGGGKVLGSFVDSGLADKVYVFYAPVIIGGQEAVSLQGQGFSKVKEALKLTKVKTRRFADNYLISGYVSRDK